MPGAAICGSSDVSLVSVAEAISPTPFGGASGAAFTTSGSGGSGGGNRLAAISGSVGAAASLGAGTAASEGSEFSCAPTSAADSTQANTPKTRLGASLTARRRALRAPTLSTAVRVMYAVEPSALKRQMHDKDRIEA